MRRESRTGRLQAAMGVRINGFERLSSPFDCEVVTILLGPIYDPGVAPISWEKKVKSCWHILCEVLLDQLAMAESRATAPWLATQGWRLLSSFCSLPLKRLKEVYERQR